MTWSVKTFVYRHCVKSSIWSYVLTLIKLIDYHFTALALYILTRARQKPAAGETPLLLINPNESFDHQDHWLANKPLGLSLFYPVHLTGILPQRGSNPHPSDHEPNTLPWQGILTVNKNSACQIIMQNNCFEKYICILLKIYFLLFMNI